MSCHLIIPDSTIGAGGVMASYTAGRGASGQNTVFDTHTAVGGGGAAGNSISNGCSILGITLYLY